MTDQPATLLKPILALLLVISFLSLVGVSPTRAETQLLPFGGIVIFEEECTCTAGNFWIWFAPLYLGGQAVLTGPLVYSPISTVLYGYYEIGVPGTWHLGDYIPGVQACWMISGNSCTVFPSIGLMNKVGTNTSE